MANILHRKLPSNPFRAQNDIENHAGSLNDCHFGFGGGIGV
jgi:hypothetical protein